MAYGRNGRKYTMKERMNYMQNRLFESGAKAAYANGYMKGVQDQKKASSLAKKRANEKDKKDKKGGKK